MKTVSEQTSEIRKWWLKNAVYLFLAGAILFLGSGDLKWMMAWAYLLAATVVVVVNGLSIDTDLLVERAQLQKGTKRWDVFLAGFVAIWGPFSIWVVAGLDRRWGWSGNTWWVGQAVSLGLFVAGSLLGTWSMMVNRFFSGTVRIQTERGHKVVTGGPYRYVRHPGYTGAIVAILMTPSALGEWGAFVPSLLVVVAFIVRTYLEDSTLQAELKGYKEYTRSVRYRLCPGIW